MKKKNKKIAMGQPLSNNKENCARKESTITDNRILRSLKPDGIFAMLAKGVPQVKFYLSTMRSPIFIDIFCVQTTDCQIIHFN